MPISKVRMVVTSRRVGKDLDPGEARRDWGAGNALFANLGDDHVNFDLQLFFILHLFYTLL